MLVKALLRGDVQSSGGTRGGEVPASNEMHVKSLIHQGFATPPDDVSGGIFARKSVAAGQCGRAAGELEGAKCPPRMKCASKA